MTLLSGVPETHRALVGEALSVSVRAEQGAVVAWWREGAKVADGDRLFRPAAEASDTGTYVVRAVKGSQEEMHAVRVAVTTAERSVSVDLPRKWRGWTVTLALVVTGALTVCLAGPPVARAIDLAQIDGRPDAALIAEVLTAAGVVLLMTGAFVGVTAYLVRARSDKPDRVQADAVDPVVVSKVVASLERPRLAAVLLTAGLLLVAIAAVLAWRLAGAFPPAETAAVTAHASTPPSFSISPS